MSDISFKGRNVLIAGGLGFIGSNLARRLVKLGAQVTLADSMIPEYGANPFNIADIEDKVQINISDVRDKNSMNDLVQGQDYLFNLTGQTSHLDSMRDPFADLEINVKAQLSILESCRKYNPDIKVAFGSTRQVYGKPNHLPVDEKHPLRPVDVNGINKMAGEWYHILYSNVHGIRACVLRLTNTYGPRMRVKDARQMFLGIWIRQLIEGDPIQVYGDGKQIRDFNFVDDVVEALLLAAGSEEVNGEVFNLGADDPICLRDLAQMMIGIHGSGEYRIVPFPAEREAIDIGDYCAEYGKIRTMLGWEPRVSLRDGLSPTIDFYRDHHDKYWGTA
ncbi:NAD-dependent epimerase/dehydratase family protein [Candidatus Bipolaricaulota bacterium]